MLLENAEIPCEQPGRHRRVLLSDVLTYRERRSVQAREALGRMAEITNESGMYELTATTEAHKLSSAWRSPSSSTRALLYPVHLRDSLPA